MNPFCKGDSFLYLLPFLRHYKFRKVFTVPIGDHSGFSPANTILAAISILDKFFRAQLSAEYLQLYTWGTVFAGE